MQHPLLSFTLFVQRIGVSDSNRKLNCQLSVLIIKLFSAMRLRSIFQIDGDAFTSIPELLLLSLLTSSSMTVSNLQTEANVKMTNADRLLLNLRHHKKWRGSASHHAMTI